MLSNKISHCHMRLSTFKCRMIKNEIGWKIQFLRLYWPYFKCSMDTCLVATIMAEEHFNHHRYQSLYAKWQKVSFGASLIWLKMKETHLSFILHRVLQGARQWHPSFRKSSLARPCSPQSHIYRWMLHCCRIHLFYNHLVSPAKWSCTQLRT